MEDSYFEFISDSTSTGQEDRISSYASPFLPEICLDTEPQLFLPVSLQIPEELLEGQEDKSITLLCDICHKSIIKLNEPSATKKKRKTSENQLIVASMRVCKDCRMLDINDLKKTSASAQGKIVMKRENAKRRVIETEKLSIIKEEQEKLLDENLKLSEGDKKKMKQVIRNRISAQQSRDRKKAYLAQIEEENEKLQEQNNLLKYKIQELSQENNYLKNQLSGLHLQGPSNTTIRGTVFGLLVFAAVILIVNSNFSPSSPTHNERHLLTASSEFNNDGVNENSESVSSSPSAYELGLLGENSGSIVQYREWRIDQIEGNRFLEVYEPCGKEPDRQSMTTVYCPRVQTYWEYPNTGLKHLQLIMPINSLPMIDNYTDKSDLQDYMLEIFCVVTDVNILPITSSNQ